MLIKKCIASKPGLFDNTTIELNEGLNIIYGKNGSGKSVLSRAMVEVLWGQVLRRPFLKDSLWENFYLEVYVTDSPRNYRFSRNSDKLFSVKGPDYDREDLLQAVPATDGAETAFKRDCFSGDDAALSRLYEKFDFDTLCTAVFVSSPTEQPDGNPLRYDSIKNIFLEDDSKFYSLYRAISACYGQGEMTKRVHNEVLNEILKTEVQLKDLEKKIQIIDLQRSKSEKLANEKVQAVNELLSIEKQIAELREHELLVHQIQTSMDKRDGLDENIKRLEDESREFREKTDLSITRGKEIEVQFPQFRDFSDIKKQNLKKLQETYREIRDIHIALDQYYSAKAQRRRRINYIAGAAGFSCLSLLFVMTKRHFSFIPPKQRFNALMALLAFTGAAIALLYLSLLIPFRPRVRDELLRKKTDIIEKLHGILRENGIELHDFRLEAVYEFLLQYFEDYGEYTEKQLELFILKESLKDPDQYSSLQSQLDQCIRERALLDAEISGNLSVVAGRHSPQAGEEGIGDILSGIKKEIAALEEQQETRKRILQQVESDIRGTADNSGELKDLDGQKALLETRLKGLLAHQRSIHFILELFSRVIERREGSQMSRLVKSSKDIFNYITSNQYITTLGSETVRDFIMDNTRTGDLNSAMVHILILSIKIALSEFLAESNIAIPLIIDDPFVFMDEKRSENLKKLLAETSRQRQIIVFTQHSHYLNPGNRIEL